MDGYTAAVADYCRGAYEKGREVRSSKVLFRFMRILLLL